MTPAARAQAAIEILGAYQDGTVLEKAIQAWSRRSRFAGSKDRAAVRDIVFDAVRKRRSCGAWPTGSVRLWVARVLKDQGFTAQDLYGAGPYAPDALSDAEHTVLADPIRGVANLPDWIDENIRALPGLVDPDDVLASYDDRAPVFVRVNRRNANVSDVQASLAQEGIEAQGIADHPVVLSGLPDALVVTQGARKIAQSKAFHQGWIEVQDASSQRAAQAVPIDGAVLDYCAGGGGKALALADRGAQVTAHDVSAKRLANISERAARAGVAVTLAPPGELAATAQFDTVLCDVPCSGSGTWRRNPEVKWDFTPQSLADYVQLQRGVLAKAIKHCKPGGCLVYVTCSVFAAENSEQIEWIKSTYPDLTLETVTATLPRASQPGGDGFYVALLRKG